MKKLGLFALLCSLTIWGVGCDKPAAPPAGGGSEPAHTEPHEPAAGDEDKPADPSE